MISADPWNVIIFSLLSLAKAAFGQDKIDIGETSYCNHSNWHTLVATEHVQAKILTLSSARGLGQSKAPSRDQCDIWVVQSKDSNQEIRVTISGLELYGDDLVFVILGKPKQVLRFDANITGDPFFDISSQDITTSSPLTLLWAHRSTSSTNDAGMVQKLAFSYMILTKTDPREVEKERYVLIGAIFVSIVTIIATIVSIARCTKCTCCRCLCTVVSIRRTAAVRYGTENNSNSNTSNARTGTGRREETIMLMELEVRGQRVEGQGPSLISTTIDVEDPTLDGNVIVVGPAIDDNDDDENNGYADEAVERREQGRSLISGRSRRHVAFDETRNTVRSDYVDSEPLVPPTHRTFHQNRVINERDSSSSSLSSTSLSSATGRPLGSQYQRQRIDNENRLSAFHSPHIPSASSSSSSPSQLPTETSSLPASLSLSSPLTSSLPPSTLSDLDVQTTSTFNLTSDHVGSWTHPSLSSPWTGVAGSNYDPPPPYCETPPPSYSVLFPECQ